MASCVAPSYEEFRFLLVGKTGSGKSTTGNTILGEKLFDSDVSFESVTSQCSLKRSRTDQRMIEIMDSPGLFDTSKMQVEISILVLQAIACMHPGPDAIFYVMKISRFTDEEFAVYQRLKGLLDESSKKYLIVLFTHGDSLKEKNMDELLKKAPSKLKEVLEECNYRYVIMDNTHPEDTTQVEVLLDLVRKLQDDNQHIPYKCPRYDFIGDIIEKEVNRRMAEVEARELQNKKHVQQLQQALQKVQKEITKEKEEFQQRERERKAAFEAQRRQREVALEHVFKAMKISEEKQKEVKNRFRDTERHKKEENKQDREEQLTEKNHKEMEKLKDEIARHDFSKEDSYLSYCTIS